VEYAMTNRSFSDLSINQRREWLTVRHDGATAA
jgi:hypothetical protein